MINCCIYFIQQVTCVFQKNCSSFALFYSLGGCFFILQSFPYMTYFRRLTCTELIGLSLAESEDLKRDELNTKCQNDAVLCFISYSMKRVMFWLSRARVFFFQEQKKCVFKTSRKAKMQMFPPAPTIVPPTRYIYINSKLLTHVILQTRRGRCIL